jgi:hypothetical protein
VGDLIQAAAYITRHMYRVRRAAGTDAHDDHENPRHLPAELKALGGQPDEDHAHDDSCSDHWVIVPCPAIPATVAERAVFPGGGPGIALFVITWVICDYTCRPYPTVEEWALIAAASIYSKAFLEALVKRHADGIVDLLRNRFREKYMHKNVEIGLDGDVSATVAVTDDPPGG